MANRINGVRFHRVTDEREPKAERVKNRYVDSPWPSWDDDSFDPITLLPDHIAARASIRQYAAVAHRLGIDDWRAS